MLSRAVHVLFVLLGRMVVLNHARL